MNININDYNLVKLDNIEIKNSTDEIFYDIEVEDYNTFHIVTNNDKSILVHNCDGYHIKGLILNVFQTYWPELLNMNPSFISEFITPIVIVTSGKKRKMFYRINDYNKWVEETENSSSYNVKYFKGLGTLGPQLGKELFKDLNKHLIPFKQVNSETTNNVIDLAFNKSRQDDRKEWLSEYIINKTFDKFAQKTTYESFINNEFIEFSMEDNIRSIPSLMDGLKPSQRKILYTIFKLDNKNELNVAELFGYVKAKAEYHHGNLSLEQTIIGMAQDFLGSNNIPLLEPLGTFGTRLNGGKDCAAARYIYTKLNNITKDIFISTDNNIVDYLIVDGKSVEPNYYIPIIPTVLLNKSDGIGTGWSTSIPSFKIEDLVDYIDNKLARKRKNIELKPYYEGFKGEITYDDESKSYTTTGVFTRTNTTTINITELPIGVWNDNYYNLLDKLVDDKMIRSYTKDCTDTDVDIKVRITKEQLDVLSDDDLVKLFELTSKIRVSNMHLFDINGKIKKYENQYEIIDDYFDNRLGFYDRRKGYLIDKLSTKKHYYDNLIKFLKLVLNKKIIINNVPIGEIIKSLELNKIDKIEDSYDYLLSMSLYKLTKEQLDKLKEDYKKLVDELEVITNTPIEKMWHDDLSELRKSIKKMRK